MTSKTIYDLPSDIAKAFHEGVEVSDEHLNEFTSTIGSVIKSRLTKRPDEPPSLRMSKIGTKDRKLWYEHNFPIPRSATPDPNALKFVYGDMIEALVVFLAKVTGHKVEDEQKEVIVNGVVGHKDFRLDGVTTDCKSASPFSFRKFKDGTLFGNDPFGYVAQLSGYLDAENESNGAFLAVDKVSGEIAICPLTPIDKIDSHSRIDRQREVIAMSSPPEEKCYPSEPYGKSGNMTLNANCGYCQYKYRCWAEANQGQGLRAFKYANGPVYFTEVNNLPRVEEVDLSGEKTH